MDNIEKLILEVVNAQAMRDLVKEAEKNETAILALNKHYQSGKVSVSDYNRDVALLGQQLGTTRKQLDATRESSRNYGQNLTALGYAVNDFTSVSGGLDQRLGAVANNMPGILAGFGAWGLVLSGILPVLGMVIKNLESFKGLLGGDELKQFEQDLDGLRKQLKYLEDLKIKLDVDYRKITETKEEIEKAHKALDAFNAAKSGRTEVQHKAAEQAKSNVAENAGGDDEESGAENLQGFLKTRMERSGEILKGGEGLLNRVLAVANRLELARGALAASEGMVERDPVQEQAQAGAIKRLEAEQAKVKDALEHFKKEKVAGLIGGYLQGIERDRKHIEELIDADPAAAAKAGVGAQFRASLMLGAAPEIRAHEKEQRDQAREKGGRELDKARAQKPLDAAARFDRFGPLAGELARKAEKQTIDPQEQERIVREGVQAALADDLARQGLDPDAKQIRATAEAIARRAIDEYRQLARQIAEQDNQQVKADALAFQARQGREHVQDAGGLAVLDRAAGGAPAPGGGGFAPPPAGQPGPLLGGPRGPGAAGPAGGPAAMAPPRLPLPIGGGDPRVFPAADPLRGLKGVRLKQAKQRQRVKAFNEAKEQKRIRDQLARDKAMGVRHPAAKGPPKPRPPQPQPAGGVAGDFDVPGIPAAMGFDPEAVRQYFELAQAVMAQQAGALQQMQGQFTPAMAGLQRLQQLQFAMAHRGQGATFPAIPESY